MIGEGLQIATREAQLRGWPKLSVHLKIDAESSESSERLGEARF